MCLKRNLAKIHLKNTGKPAGAKIRENASPHFQSQGEEVSGQLLADGIQLLL